MKIRVNTARCIEIAEYIKTVGGVPLDIEDPMAYSFPSNIVHNAWWAVVAINQQTTPVAGLPLCGSVMGKKLRGWDYLLQKAIFCSNKNSELFTKKWLLEVSPDELRKIYHDEEVGDTLNQISTRASLLNGLGKLLNELECESINYAYLISEGFIIRSDGKGIAQILSKTRAYSDPVQKKTFYFLAIMRNQGLWSYKDELNLSAPVNYHEQRGSFRLGTVTIADEELKRKIMARENITDEEDIEIRLAVRRALEFIAQYLDVSPSRLHYYFWNHIRNCCSREHPHCKSCDSSCTLPKRYRVNGDEKCIFESVCSNALLSVNQMLIEPRLDTTIWQ
ncbi:MAG: hypothetical protein WCW87_03060 [Candidatus Paceibacterota bacterium]